MSILIVDDEKEIADLVDVILKNEGFVAVNEKLRNYYKNI